MRNEAFLASYPALQYFLAEHPWIPQNAPYYLQHVHGGGGWDSFTPQQRIVSDVLGWLAGFTAFAVILGALIWIVRTTLDYRRCNRLSRIQAEVHTKLMDRFSSNDELLDLRQALVRLKPRGRQLLWLAYAQGSSHSAIAESLGLRSSSIKPLLFRARRRLADLLRGARTGAGERSRS